MSDVNANIGINFDTQQALASLRQLQAGLSRFHQTLAEGNLAAANAQKGLNAQLMQSINATGKFSASQKTVATSTAAFTNALEKNQLSLKQYFRYSAAAATANTKVLNNAFAAEREILNRARRDRVKALQSQYIQLSKANGDLAKTLRVMPKSLEMVNGRFTELGTRIQMAAQKQQFLNQLLKQGSTQLLNYGKNMQWAGRQLMVGLTIPLTMFASAAAKAFKELEAETVAFRRVYGDMFTNDTETDAAIKNIKKIGMEYTKFGVAVKDTMNMAATAAAAGFSGAGLDAQVKQASKLAVLGQIDQQKALETTISLQNAFGISSEQLASKIDFLNAVENQTVVSLDDITTAIPKVAPVIKQLGGSVEDLAFFMTAMKEGGINASEGANALKSGLASLINPSKKSAAFLADLGININGIVESNAGNLKGTVVGFARALDELAPLQRSRAIEQLFGKFQFARLSTLFQNVTKDGSQASRALNLAGASIEELAVLSEREMKKVEDAVGTKFQAAIEQFKTTIMPIGKQFLEAVTPLVEFFGKVMNKFNDLGDGTKKAIGIIVAALGFIGPTVLMTFGLLANGAANVIKFFAMLRGGIAKLNGQTNVLGGGFDYLTQQEIENLAQSNALHTSHQKLISVFNVEKSSLDSLASAYANAASQARNLANSSPGLFAAPGARSAVARLPQTKRYADGVLSVPGPKGAGDVTPAMLSPGESVIPTKQTEKHRGLIKAILADKVPGHMAGRIGAAAKTQSARNPLFLGMPKTFKETSIRIANQKMVHDIDRAIKNGPLGALPPSDFGRLVAETKGHSFPIPGVGGIYEKGGKQVFVKPVTDIDAARAELLSTTAFTPAHGLIAPKQEIKTMLDPTDANGKRRLAVLVSPYDPKFANPDGKFTKQQMADQLYASALRGDKDLQTANVSGNMVIDAGTSYAYGAASGLRTQTTSLKSVLEQASINTLGVKGGARRAFVDSIAPIAKKMTADEFHTLMSGTVTAHNARLATTLATTKLTAKEKEFYTQNILNRGKEAEDINWRDIHSNIVNLEAAAKKKELTAAAIEKKFQEQQLKKRQSGHANKDFYVDGLMAGRLGEGGTQLSNMDKAIDDLDKAYADHPDEEIKKKYNKNKSEIKSLISQRFTHDPLTDTYTFTDDDGRTTKPFDQKTFNDKVKYVMGDGVKLDKDGNPTNSKRRDKIATASSLKREFSQLGAVSTGANYAEKKALKELDLENKSKMSTGNDEKIRLKLRQQLTSVTPKLSPKQIDKFVGTHVAHLYPTDQTGMTPKQYQEEKWKSGFAFNDISGLNNYVNNIKDGKKFEKVINSEKFMLAKEQGGLGYNAQDKRRAQAALDFGMSGRQPMTHQELRHVAELAKLEIEANKYGLMKSKNLYQAQGVVAIEQLRNPDFYKDINKRMIQLTPDRKPIKGVDKSMVVAYQPGEIYYSNGKRVPLTAAHGTPISQTNIKKKPGSKDTHVTTIDKKASIIPNRAPTAAGMAVRFASSIAAKRANVYHADNGYNFRGMTQGQADGMAIGLQKQGGVSDLDIERKIRREDQRLWKLKVAETAAAEKAAKTQLQQQREEANRAKKAKALEEKSIALKQRMATLEQDVEKAHKEALRTNKKMDRETAKVKRGQASAARQEKVGRYAGGASAALGGVAMGAMMTGADSKVTGALFGASAVAGMAPMLSNPYIAAGTAVVALAASVWMADKAFKAAAERQSRLVDSTSATTEKMKAIGEMTGKVGASEIFARKRRTSVSDRYTTGFERGKQQFGATFMGDQVGKDMITNISESLKSGSTNTAKQVAVELAGYISDGILTSQQAHSIAEQIGIDLNNSSLGANISGTLLDLVGPAGEDLLKNPLEVRIKLVNEQQSLTDDFTREIETWANANTGSRSDSENEATIKYAAASAAAGAQNLEFNQAQIDSLDNQYDKELKILETQKAATTDKEKQAKIDAKIVQLGKDRAKGTKDLRANGKTILDNQMKIFKLTKTGTGGNSTGVQNAFFTGLKDQVTAKYKDDPAQTSFLKDFFKGAQDAGSQEIEVKLNTVVGSGQMPPATAVSLMRMFAGKEGELDKVLNTTTEVQDPGKVVELINSLGGIKKNDTKRKIVTEIIGKNPEEADKLMSTLALIQKMSGKEINIEAFFKDPKKAIEKLKKLKDNLEKVELMDEPINVTVIEELQKDPDMPGMEALIKDWKTYANLPDKIKKSVIQQYVTIEETITDEQALASIKAKNPNARRITRSWIDQEKQKMAAERVMQLTKNDIDVKKGDGTTPTPVARKNQELDTLLRRAKFTSDAAIKETGGTPELKRITPGAGAMTKFSGIVQQLMGPKGGSNAGANREFISWLENMDEAARGAYIDLEKLKKGIVELTPAGEDAAQVFNENTFREFAVSQTTAASAAIAQRGALVKLKTAGYDTATALEMVADANLAVAINSAEITPDDLKAVREEAERAKNEVLGLANALATASSEASTKLTDLARELSVAQSLKSKYPGITKEQLAAVMQNPDIVKELENLFAGKASDVDAEKIKKNLQNVLDSVKLTAVAQLKVDLEVNEVETRQNVFSKITENMSKYFTVRRNKVQKDFRDRLKALQEDLNPFNRDKDGKAISTAAKQEDAQKAYDAAEKIANAEISRYEKQVEEIEKNAKEGINADGTKDPTGGIDAAEEKVKVLQKNADEASKIVDDLQKKVTAEEKRIYEEYDNPLTKGTIGFKQREIDVKQRDIEENIDRPIQDQQKIISDAERKIEVEVTRPIEDLQKISSKYSDDLTLMDRATEGINEKYDKQAEALTKVQEINQNILALQQDQLDLAGALSSGDISAAAQAAQKMRSTAAAQFATGQTDALEQSRKNALGSLTSSSGMTRAQIEEQQWQISRKIVVLESESVKYEKEIFDAKEKIVVLEKSREDKLRAIRDLEDEIYTKTIERQIALDALALGNAKKLEDAQAAAQKASEDLATAQETLAKKLEERDAKIKAAQKAHDEAMVKLNKDLADAETKLAAANEALTKAQTALAKLQDEIDKANAEIEKEEQDFKDLEDQIAAAETAAFDFTDQLFKATEQAGLLAAALRDKAKADAEAATAAHAVVTALDAKAAAELKAKQEAEAKAAADKAAQEAAAKAVTNAAAVAAALAADAAAEAAAAMVGDGGTTTGSTTTTTTPTAAPTITTTPTKTVVVQSGDTLSKIAQAEGISLGELLEANPKFTSDPKYDDGNKIFAGTTVKIPGTTTSTESPSGGYGGGGGPNGFLVKSSGGLIPKYLNFGGAVMKAIGTDTIPAMLTPGEFIVSKHAVDNFGVNNLKAINSGSKNVAGDSVYNYSISVNVRSDANADDIARTVMAQIKQVDSQKIRGVRI